jgi:shikimate kinase
MNLVFVGPCGVGKSTVAKSLAEKTNMMYLDFDEVRSKGMEKYKEPFSPFSVSRLNLRKILPLIIQNETSSNFVLDIGGGTVFRETADNDERFAQVLEVKKTYNARIIILSAKKDILMSRFISVKGRKFYEENTWESWINIEEPYWKKCSDVYVDTSFLRVDEIVEKILEQVKNNN